MPVPIQADFFAGVCEDFTRGLSALGITPPNTSNLPDTSRALELASEYFHALQRRIPPQPRKVLWSAELRGRALSAEDREAVERIAAEFERGDDVFPRMSKSILKSVRETISKGSYDGLLTDWGIHHLHIGKDLEADGVFVERGGPLLFVFVTGDSAYLLDLLGHGTSSFINRELLEILHTNWPEVIAEWRAAGFVPDSSTQGAMPKERRKMREKFLMVTPVRDGTLYLPPGSGVMTSGHSSSAVQLAMSLLNLVRPAEDWVRQNAEWIHDQVARRIGAPVAELHMRFETRLSLLTGAGAVCETRTDIRFLGVPPNNGTPVIAQRKIIENTPAVPPRSI